MHKELQPRSQPAAPRPPARCRRGRTDPSRAPSASPRAAIAAAEGREGAKYRCHTKPSHTHTSAPKPYPPKAAFSEGRPPSGAQAYAAGHHASQLQRQRDARRGVQEGGDGERGGQHAGRGNTGRGAAGDRGSARGWTQGMDQSACGKERGEGYRQGSWASSSGGGQAHGAGQSAGSGRRDTGHSAEHGQGHGKDAGTSSSAPRRTQRHRQGTRASSSGGGRAHGAGQGVGSGRGRNQGHEQGHGKDVGISRTGKGAGDRGQDPRRGPEGRGEGVHPNLGLGAGRGPRGKDGKGDVDRRGQTGQGTGKGGGAAGRRAREEGRGAPAAGRPGGAVHPPQYPADAGALRQPPPAPVHLQHRPRLGALIPPQPPRPPTSRPPTRRAAPRTAPPLQHESRGRDRHGWPLPRRRGGPARHRCNRRRSRVEPARGARGGPGQFGPGLGRDLRPTGGRGPHAGDGAVWVAELGHLRNHQGAEELALRCRAPPEGRREPGSTPGGTGGPGGPQKGPPARDSGGVA